MSTKTPHSEGKIRWIPLVVVVGTLWGLLALIVAAIIDRTAENLTLLCSIASSGAFTLLLYATRRYWLPRVAYRPVRNAILLGIFNAAIVEMIFLLFEHLFAARGIAAHPHLLIDLFLTLPWYALMVRSFVHIYHRRRFSPATVLLLGAVYELGADGIVGPIVALTAGETHILEPGYWFLLILIAFWQFIPVYSSMMLPSTWVLDITPPPTAPSDSPLRDALRPLLWLIPFMGYLLIALLLLTLLSPS